MSSANAAIAGVAAAIAALAIVGGIFLTKDKGDGNSLNLHGARKDILGRSLSLPKTTAFQTLLFGLLRCPLLRGIHHFY